MKIAVVSNKVPFLRGGAEELLDALVVELRKRGLEAEPIQLAFKWHPPQRVLDHMLAARLTQIPGVDRVVALKFPAYYVPHDDKVLWLLHQFRQAYDLWGGPLQDLPSNAEGEAVREAVIAADNRLLPDARRIFVNSEITRDRLWRFNGIASEVLMAPLVNADSYRTDTQRGYIFAGGRINPAKRQLLLVEAMKHVRSGARLVIAGAPETAADAARVQARVSELGVGDRVELMLRWVSHQEKVELIAGALAAAYIPVDEDSYGYVTLEALEARKPVITCADSGGTKLLVKDGVTGVVSEPDARAVAEAIDRLALDPQRALKMGEDGKELVDSLDITWDHVVERLTA
jgi:glycosyltransferase involved in cell wall biosynthesis